MDRRFEVVTDGSNQAEMMCRNYFEPVADFFAGENFHESDQIGVKQERTTLLSDGCEVEISFEAIKIQADIDEIFTQYNVCIAISRPFDGTFYWPGLSENELMTEHGQVGSELVTVDILSDDEFAEYEDDEEDMDDEDEFDMGVSAWSIKEVHDFYLDDDTYKPRKDIRFEYYDEDGDLLGIVNATDSETSGKILSDIPDEDIELQVLEGSFSSSFSEEDLKMIYGILGRFGFH